MGHALKTASPDWEMTAVKVRDAGQGDMDAIQAVYAHYVLNTVATFEETVPTLDEMMSRRSNVLAQGLPWLVAEAGGAVVGFAYAAAYRSRPAYRFTVEDSIYVAQGYGAHGIGSALLDELIRRCEAGPWRQMVAVIGDSRNEACVKLHRNFGFASAGKFKAVGYKFGQWVDTVMMQRPLGDGEWSSPRL